MSRDFIVYLQKCWQSSIETAKKENAAVFRPRFFVYRKPLARRVVQEKTYVDNEEIETPFAIIGVRSANCTNKQREVIQK